MKDKKKLIGKKIFSPFNNWKPHLLYTEKDLKSDIYLKFMLLNKRAAW